MKKVALFGGSFNPPHLGHKMLIELVRAHFPCDEMWLLPSGDRKDKKMHVTSEHRVAMAQIIAHEIEQTPGTTIKISFAEIESPAPTTTISTLKKLKELHTDCEFHFVVTTETLPGIKEFWIEGEKLFNETSFIIVERPGAKTVTAITLPPTYTVLSSSTPLPHISSTELRAMHDQNELRKVTTKGIADYIVKNNLYGCAK